MIPDFWIIISIMYLSYAYLILFSNYSIDEFKINISLTEIYQENESLQRYFSNINFKYSKKFTCAVENA